MDTVTVLQEFPQAKKSKTTAKTQTHNLFLEIKLLLFSQLHTKATNRMIKNNCRARKCRNVWMKNFLFSKPTAITRSRVKVEGSYQRSNNSSARKHCEKTN